MNMGRNPYSLTVALLLCTTMTNATVWRVNNNPALVQGQGNDPCDHCFTNLQVAADDQFVNPGDTLHLEASAISYGDLTLTKRLVIIGPGYRLGQGTANNPGLQASNLMASVGRIILDSPAANGTIITGIRCTNWLSIVNTSNIKAIRNLFDGGGIGFSDGTGSGYVITCNYFNDANISWWGNAAWGTYSNFVITNNYIEGLINLDPPTSNVVIANNLFNWNGTHAPYGAEVKNNIFVQGAMAVNNNNIHHNAAAGANNLPAGSNNLNNVVFTSVFNPAYTSDDQKWRLSANYLTYMNLVGDDGTVPGMFGGSTPYRPSGIPAIPAVYQLAAPATAVQGAPINVTIGTRSND